MLIWLAIGFTALFGWGALRGAPYLPMFNRDVEAMLDLLALKPGQTVIDLGSGDGRLLAAAAKRGLKAIGYEINPVLVLYAICVTWRYRDQIRIHWGDYWRRDWPVCDGVVIFLIGRYMKRLDTELKLRLERPTKVASYVFQLPRAATKVTRNTFLYLYP